MSDIKNCEKKKRYFKTVSAECWTVFSPKQRFCIENEAEYSVVLEYKFLIKMSSTEISS